MVWPANVVVAITHHVWPDSGRKRDSLHVEYEQVPPPATPDALYIVVGITVLAHQAKTDQQLSRFGDMHATRVGSWIKVTHTWLAGCTAEI